MGRYKQVMWFFIHMNFQDLQQKRNGIEVEVQKIMGMGKILRAND